MRFPLVVAAVFATAAFAGCVTEPTPDVPDTGDDIADLVNSLEGYVDPFLMDHDHADAGLHDLFFHTKPLAHDPMGGDMVKSSGAHVIDLQAGWLFVGAYGLAADVDGGLYIYDLKDPASPKLTGHFALPGNVGGDRSVEATDDANWVVMGTEAIDCANHVNPFAPGLFLIDVRDKSAPKLADYRPDSGVHSVIVHRVGSTDYAATLGGDLTTSGQNIWEIDAANGKLVPVGRVPIAHDGAAYDDPILGIPTFYITGSTTLDVYDFTDPASPEKLGSWTPPDVKNHYVHAVTMDIIEGRRILVVESEDWGELVSPMWVLDATDFDNIELISTWTNPAQAPANAGTGGNSLAFSTHNPRFEDGIIYMAHYHAGVWILDLRTLEKARAPEVMGYFVPHEDNGGYKPQSSQSAAPLPANAALCFGGFTIHELPNVMDVEVLDGVVYAADLHTGLYTLQYDATALLPMGHQH